MNNGSSSHTDISQGTTHSCVGISTDLANPLEAVLLAGDPFIVRDERAPADGDEPFRLSQADYDIKRKDMQDEMVAYGESEEKSEREEMERASHSEPMQPRGQKDILRAVSAARFGDGARTPLVVKSPWDTHIEDVSSDEEPEQKLSRLDEYLLGDTHLEWWKYFLFEAFNLKRFLQSNLTPIVSSGDSNRFQRQTLSMTEVRSLITSHEVRQSVRSW